MDGRHRRQASDGIPNPLAPQRPPLQRVEGHVLRRMSAGILVLIPLLITVLVVRLIIVSIDGVVRPLPYVRERPWDFAGIGLLAALLVFYLVGALVTSRAGRWVVVLQGAVLSRIPLVKNIYNVAAEVTETLSGPLAQQFRRVVLVEWPRPGVLSLGFVTGRMDSPKEPFRSMVAVYIPTAPNPTSGFVAFMNEEDVIETDYSVEEAMKIVFSGGIVLPYVSRIKSDPEFTTPPRN